MLNIMSWFFVTIGILTTLMVALTIFFVIAQRIADGREGWKKRN